MLRNGLFILLCLCFHHAFSSRIQGIVLDENQQALPFVNVFIQGTSTGTLSNELGAFHLDIPHKGILEFRYLGYHTHYEEVSEADSNRRFRIVMKPRAELLPETVIDGNKNPADAIMRQVIDNRRKWDIEGSDYQCEVYIKGLQRAENVPDKIMGQKIDRESLGLDSSGNGIFYLFESVNSLYFQHPSTYQETVKSSRVSGKNNAFSYVRASNLVLDFNQSLVPCFDMKRGVVSPIAGNGFFYYHYRLEGIYFEGDQKYYRITFSPKRENDPAGKGILIIRDSLWYTQSLQLTLYRKNQLQLLDSLQIHTEYQRYDDHYLPASNQLKFGLNIFGIGANGYFFTQYLDYNFSPSMPAKKRPKREVLLIDDMVNKRDSIYWDSIRPVPLTPLEVKDYRIKDSVEVRRSNKSDSSQSSSNFGWNWFWAPVSGTLFHKNVRWRSRSLLKSFQYNTVEGFVIEPQLEVLEMQKNSDRSKKYSQLTFRYGLSNTRFGGRLYSEFYGLKPVPFTFSTEIAHITTAIDGDNGMDPTMNSLYSLIVARNYLKFYQRSAFGPGIKATVLNGLELRGRYSLERRESLENSSTYSFRQENSAFTPNNFLPGSFPDHTLHLAEFGFRLVPFNQYIRTPDGKINLGSRWPVFSGKYTLTLPGLGGQSRFQKLELRMDWKIRVGILGNTKISAGFGTFTDRSTVFTPDYFHMNANPSFYQKGENRMLRMQTLYPYRYSTDKGYAQVHIQHNFDGFLLNKIPGVRLLRAREFIGLQSLLVPGMRTYYEFSFGLEQLALYKKDPGLLRLEFVVGTDGSGYTPKISLGYNF